MPSQCKSTFISLVAKVAPTGWLNVFLIAFLCTSTPGCSLFYNATNDGPIEEDFGKRTAGAMIDDEFIEGKAKHNLNSTDELYSQGQLKVSAYNGVVLLTGNVADQQLRSNASSIVKNIRKVRKVVNELEVGPPRSFGSSANDGWLHQKIRWRYRFTDEIPSGRIKIIVTNEVAYLMGLVTPSEADLIARETQKVKGLQKIVRAFEYIES